MVGRTRRGRFPAPPPLAIVSLSPEPLPTLFGVTTVGVNAPLDRKLRMGLIGGGQGAFIGRVHTIAAIMDNQAALVAGAFSSSAEKSKASAPDYDVRPERAYGSYQE